MKDGICAKCGETEVYTSNDDLVKGDVPISLFSKTSLRIYVCAMCGYVEHYVQNEKDLIKITDATAFKKVEG